LWIVATPIGALQDLAPRARELLEDVDLILAEDTRRTRSLLSSVGIRAHRRLRSFHEHNEARRVQEIMTLLGVGQSVALLSDAGTPVLSDPGFLLIRAARQENIPVKSVPGPSAFTAALAASGQPPLPVVLVGFLPAKKGSRRRRVQEYLDWPHSLVLLLSPHRLSDELAEVADVLGHDRPATLMAEISKVHERAEMGTLGELVASAETQRPRGEYVLVVGPEEGRSGPAPDIDHERVRVEYDRAVSAGADRRQALKIVAATLGLSRRQVYQMLIDSEPDAD